jgi:hypothetical protein
MSVAWLKYRSPVQQKGDRRMSRNWGWRAVAASTLVLLAAGRAAAGPSTILNTYALFAQDNLRVRTLTLNDGDMGVNNGLLYLRGAVLGQQSDFVGDMVHLDSTTACDNLFANAVVGPSLPTCPTTIGMPVPRPVITDLAGACGFQTPATPCSNSLASDVIVDHLGNRTLAPGTYRNVVVEGGGEGPATLKLSGGDYHFCDVRVGRNGSMLFQAPSTVFIDGNSRVSNAADVGPDPLLGAAAPPPGAIKWFVAGSQARFSRRGVISLYACAPNAKMVIGSGTSLTGRFVARSIRLKKSIVTFAPPVPGVCGDTVISPDEQCEVDTDCPTDQVCDGCACKMAGCDDDEDCNPGSPGGGFVCENGECVPGCDDDQDCNCNPGGSPGGGFVCQAGHCVPGCNDDQDCCNQGSPGGGFVCQSGSCVPGCDDDMDCNGSAGGGFVCEDGHCVPGTTTTTTTTTGASTTSTPGGSTTSTTLKPCTMPSDCPVGVCRDGFCVPECDDDEDCRAASPTGSFVCIDGRCVPGGEICGDCTDNDNDGFTDFEDPDCCDPAADQRSELELKKGKFRPRAAGQSRVRLKGGLARSGLAGKIEPTAQQVLVQIRSDAGEVLCAAIPAGKFVRKKKQAFRFSAKRTPLPVEMGRNIDRVVIKVLKSGQVRFRVKGKRAALTTPAEGRLTITFGFARPGTDASQNACSQGVRVFRGGKKGQLTFP